MLDVARREVDRLPEAVRGRIRFVQADASAVPVADASFDLLTTGFVLQQVPDRQAVLREFHRILRPGGVAAIYGWIQETVPFAPEVELEAALVDAGVVRPPTKEVRSGHYRTMRGAAGELRSAGFTRVAPRADALDYRWRMEDFIAYRTTARDLDVFDPLDEPTRRRVIERLRRRLELLAPDQWVYRAPIVSIIARKG
jgi:SAM-dependent methyltransferase